MPPAKKAKRTEPIRTWPDTIPPPKRTLGWEFLAWTADNLLQPDGPNAGEPWIYTPEQMRIVLRWLEIDDDGKFRHRRGVLRRMKGWGKDPFLASLAAGELCGPCRFGGWDADGYPVGVQHAAPWVQVAAVSRDQTRNTMTLFPGLFAPSAIDEYKIDIGKEIIYARGSGRIESVTSSPRALEGGRPTLVIANETHHWLANNDGLEMSLAIRRNLGKSRDGSARVMEITNAHLPGENSAAEQTYEAWRSAENGVDGVYYDSTEAPPIKDFNDVDAIREGLIAARGDSTWVDVDRVLNEILDPVTPESESRRFYLNQVTAAGATWFPEGVWETRTVADPVPDGAQIVIGFDGSFNNDSTGLVGATVGAKKGDPTHVFVIAAWERPEGAINDWQVPIEEVEDAIRAACKRWAVREVACDPYRWARSMQVLAGERLPMVEFPQSPSRMIPATERFHSGIVEGSITHDGDPRLARHVANCVLKTDSRGSRLSKDSKQSLRKIDLAVCAVIAAERAQQIRKRGKRVMSLGDYL